MTVVVVRPASNAAFGGFGTSWGLELLALLPLPDESLESSSRAKCNLMFAGIGGITRIRKREIKDWKKGTA
jgi:hypothetical protein